MDIRTTPALKSEDATALAQILGGIARGLSAGEVEVSGAPAGVRMAYADGRADDAELKELAFQIVTTFEQLQPLGQLPGMKALAARVGPIELRP